MREEEDSGSTPSPSAPARHPRSKTPRGAGATAGAKACRDALDVDRNLQARRVTSSSAAAQYSRWTAATMRHLFTSMPKPNQKASGSGTSTSPDWPRCSGPRTPWPTCSVAVRWTSARSFKAWLAAVRPPAAAATAFFGANHAPRLDAHAVLSSGDDDGARTAPRAAAPASGCDKPPPPPPRPPHRAAAGGRQPFPRFASSSPPRRRSERRTQSRTQTPAEKYSWRGHVAAKLLARATAGKTDDRVHGLLLQTRSPRRRIALQARVAQPGGCLWDRSREFHSTEISRGATSSPCRVRREHREHPISKKIARRPSGGGDVFRERMPRCPPPPC